MALIKFTVPYDLLLKDLCARLPYGVKVQRYSYDDDVIESQNSLEMTGDGCADFYNSLNQCRCAAPTQSLLQRWLREEKGLYISVEAYPTLAIMGKVCFAWVVKSRSDGHFMESNDSLQTFSTYELALEDAIAYSLKNLV